jgi:hypothetical protein
MTETDIQRYAREVAAVDLTTFDPSHPTTTEYRLAHEVVRLRQENDRLHQQYLTGCLEDRATIQQLLDANNRLREELAKPLTHEAIMKRVADDVGRVIANALNNLPTEQIPHA